LLKWVAIALTASALLGACGGYLEDEELPSDCIVSGIVQDDAAQPLADARVTVEVVNMVLEATTDASGRYELTMPVALAYPAKFAGTATKGGYLPQPVVFSRSGVSCPTVDGASTQLRALSERDIVFPAGVGVTHLGDGVFTGDINSQLQVPTSGVVWTDGFTRTGATQQQYGRLCVSFLARGVQAVRQNTISVAREGQPAAEATLMTDTDPNGNYSQASYCFSLAAFAADDRINLTITAGNSGSLLDYDDFEFVSVIGTLEP
jgi:hypothetical protein